MINWELLEMEEDADTLTMPEVTVGVKEDSRGGVIAYIACGWKDDRKQDPLVVEHIRLA